MKKILIVFTLGALASLLALPVADAGPCNHTQFGFICSQSLLPQTSSGGGGGAISSGGVPATPMIGTCQEHSTLKKWQCVPSYPDTTDLFFGDYDTCVKDSTQTVAGCLKTWAAKKSFTTCGVTDPFTRDSEIPGSGEVEVPFSGALGSHETHVQCAEEEIEPKRWWNVIPLGWWGATNN